MDPTLTQLINELVNQAKIINQAKQELEAQDARIVELEEKLRGIESPDC